MFDNKIIDNFLKFNKISGEGDKFCDLVTEMYLKDPEEIVSLSKEIPNEENVYTRVDGKLEWEKETVLYKKINDVADKARVELINYMKKYLQESNIFDFVKGKTIIHSNYHV